MSVRLDSELSREESELVKQFGKELGQLKRLAISGQDIQGKVSDIYEMIDQETSDRQEITVFCFIH